MTDLLAQGASLINRVRHASLTRLVRYERGGLDPIEIRATVGQTVFKLNDGGGGTIHYESRDYLLRAIDLVLDHEIVQPKRGDRIVELGPDGEPSGAGSGGVYEVLGPGYDEPDWRWSGPDRMTARLHTREVA